MIIGNEKPTWQFVALEQFSVPDQQTTQSLHHRWNPLWQWLHRAAKGKPEQTYDPSSSRYLDDIIPEWDWAEAVPAMEEALEPGLITDKPPYLAQTIVGAPYSKIPDMLQHYARKHGWHVVEAPEPDEILTGGESWLQKLPEGSVAPLVIPNLESSICVIRMGCCFCAVL